MATVTNLVKPNIQDQIPHFTLKADRFYFIENHGWYFHCRDGQCGPFETKSDAENNLTKHIKEQKK